MLGGHSSLDPPDPIPNSEVKRARADDSVDYPCESRSPPGSLNKTPRAERSGAFLFALYPCGNMRYSRLGQNALAG